MLQLHGPHLGQKGWQASIHAGWKRCWPGILKTRQADGGSGRRCRAEGRRQANFLEVGRSGPQGPSGFTRQKQWERDSVEGSNMDVDVG